MSDKIFDGIDRFFERINKVTGIAVRFPRPGKGAWIISALLNGIIGIAFLLLGFFTSHRWMMIFGGLGIFGSITAMRQTR